MTRTGEPVIDLSAQTWSYFNASEDWLTVAVTRYIDMVFRFDNRVKIDRIRLVEK